MRQVQIVDGPVLRWPRNDDGFAALKPWLHYALASLVSTDPEALASVDEKFLFPDKMPRRLRSHVRRGVAAAHEERMPGLLHGLHWSRFAVRPHLRKSPRGAWMSPEAAALLLTAAGVTSSRAGLERLLRLEQSVEDTYLVYVSASELLVIHAAGFSAADISQNARRKGSFETLSRWAHVGLTAAQWRLVTDAGLQMGEIEDVITTGQVPDTDALLTLAALHSHAT